jgi:hypothetical protein
MRPLPEDLRLQYREAYTRRQPTAVTPVYVSYDQSRRHPGGLRAQTDPGESIRNHPMVPIPPGTVTACRMHQQKMRPTPGRRWKNLTVRPQMHND